MDATTIDAAGGSDSENQLHAAKPGDGGDGNGGNGGGKDSDKAAQAKPRPGLSDMLAGEKADFVSDLSPYLPQELIGGSVPHIPGAEEETVWNAASQACGTEKVHFCYTIDGDRVWYLACPSATMASSPDTWCPLAAALPGNSEYWDRETVYLYEQEGLASALRWDPDTGRMQVFLGAARTLLPRIQSMDANFVTINPEVADIMPWRQRMLKTEKLSRAAGRVLLLFGIMINFILLAVLAFQFILSNTVQRDLAKARQDTDRASEQLMFSAFKALQSDVSKRMVEIQTLLSELQTIDGTLVKYEIEKGQLQWEALVPRAFSEKAIAGHSVESVSIEKDGRVRIRKK